MSDKTCEERINDELEHEIQRIREALGHAEQVYDLACQKCGHKWQTEDEYEACPGCGNGDEIDVEENCDAESRDSYWQGILSIDTQLMFRVQLSTGGPGDQFEIYVDPQDHEISHIDYRFLDWFDGAERRLTGTDFDLAVEMFQDIAANCKIYAGLEAR